MAADAAANSASAIDWVQLPKVELHCHLEGAVPFATLINEYTRLGIQLPSDDEAELREYFLVDKKIGSLNAFLEKFERSQKVFTDRTGVINATVSVITDKYKDGVKLLEIRYSPLCIHRSSSLSMEDAHKAVQDGVKLGLEKCGNDIEIGLICITEAAVSDKDFDDVFNFFLNHKDDFIGFDNAAREINLSRFKTYFDKLKELGTNVTLHAAEDRTAEGGINAVDAVLKLNAKRIGHGIQLIHNEDYLKLMIERNVLLEISPTSNIITGNVDSIENHPIKKFIDLGVPVSINTDDPGLFDITLSGEHKLLHNTFGFSWDDLKKMNLAALNASFVSEAVKDRVRRKYFHSS